MIAADNIDKMYLKPNIHDEIIMIESVLWDNITYVCINIVSENDLLIKKTVYK